MRLDEEIKHCEKVAEDQEWMSEAYDDDSMGAKLCKECAEEHRQLAKWLRELQRWRKLKSTIIPKYRDGVSDEYNRGANDMWKEIMERIEEVNADAEIHS